MKDQCHKIPDQKQDYLKDIGTLLVKEHGKQQHYKPKQIKEAHNNSKWASQLDFSCWAMSIFSTKNDFDIYHEKVGEVCDYISMKAEMLKGVSGATAEQWSTIPDMDLDASWLDLETVFDGISEGFSALISGIFDGL
ncbi:hypothetical protein [Croceibacter atlanticus]|jgi:hypothetical protein|uniref:hypothetical protein n=1 Tax=Croceibacter atlanticus TaxID=313588 RepID=UPI000E916504|nr:hypothetical protein [Flavobacteriaceae bacterium]|tara:strand:+ start:1746 stop:2156 length:411 start_codon:yes stop_codon:yes gene_type:complete